MLVHIKKLEKEGQTKLKLAAKKRNHQDETEMNKDQKAIERPMKLQLALWKISKTNKTLARLINEKQRGP